MCHIKTLDTWHVSIFQSSIISELCILVYDLNPNIPFDFVKCYN